MMAPVIATGDASSLPQAVAMLRAGQVIAFPTETVYGVGVNAGDEAAQERLRALKSRDGAKPFQVLLAEAAQAETLAIVCPRARRIMEACWPGPLTLVLPARDGGAVGVRVPDQPWVCALIRELGAPLTASSANLAGEPPATTAQAVAQSLGAGVALVIDGGPARLGAASTVAQLDRAGRVTILRAGALTQDELEQFAAG